MDDMGAIFGLEVQFEDIKLIGQLQEKAKAKQQYEEAVQEGV